ncbi:hypothetical protein HOO65_050190 [Ceratocystis lukuohia]|uniref:Uncharacterized protein n=1 Tax=Ceratocystis lukuohia TaxID=2019550 RepID=A0ABR4MFN0_9PEZI
MHFFGLLSLPFLLLVGVNAGVLEDHGYTFTKFGSGYCTIHSDYYEDGDKPLNEFTINVQEKSMTIHVMENLWEGYHHSRLPLHRVLAAVCKKYGLKPDGMNLVVMNFPKSGYEEQGLDSYRRLHRDELEDDEYIDATISRGTIDEWYDFSGSTLYSGIQLMLAWSSIAEISIKESKTSCLLSYHIKPDEGGRDHEDEEDDEEDEEDDNDEADDEYE